MLGNQLVTQRRRLAVQRTLRLLAHLLLILRQASPSIFPAVLEHPINQAGQLVRCRREGTLAANAALDPTVKQSQRRLRPPQRLRRHPQGNRHTVLPFTRTAFLLGVVALVLPWA